MLWSQLNEQSNRNKLCWLDYTPSVYTLLLYLYILSNNFRSAQIIFTSVYYSHCRFRWRWYYKKMLSTHRSHCFIGFAQVLVYLPVFYNKFYDKCVLNNCSDMDKATFLSTQYTEHQGQVMSIGSRDTVENWANTNLQVQSRLGNSYVSLFALHGKPQLRDELITLMDERSVVGLHLKTTSAFLADPAKREWFSEVMDNHLKLRELNLWDATGNIRHGKPIANPNDSSHLSWYYLPIEYHTIASISAWYAW